MPARGVLDSVKLFIISKNGRHDLWEEYEWGKNRQNGTFVKEISR